MKKILVLFIAVLWSGFILPNYSSASNIELRIREFNCLQNGNAVIRFSLINNRNFDYPNVSLCFVIMKEGNPIACRELRTVVEKGVDGSQIYETVIKTSCEPGSYGLKSTVFLNAKRYQIEEWFSGCPGTWKSTGQDVLE